MAYEYVVPRLFETDDAIDLRRTIAVRKMTGTSE